MIVIVNMIKQKNQKAKSEESSLLKFIKKGSVYVKPKIAA